MWLSFIEYIGISLVIYQSIVFHDVFYNFCLNMFPTLWMEIDICFQYTYLCRKSPLWEEKQIPQQLNGSVPLCPFLCVTRFRLWANALPQYVHTFSIVWNKWNSIIFKCMDPQYDNNPIKIMIHPCQRYFLKC